MRSANGTRHRSGGPLRAWGVCLAALCLLAGLLCSCRTTPYTPSQRKVEKLVGLIDSGGVGGVKGLASAPFLLDGEILLRQSDVDAAWANLKASGFDLGKPRLASIERVDETSYKLFAENMEVRSFFKNYLNKDSVLVGLEAASGRYWLILNREVKGYPRIQGIRGPLK